MSTLPQKSIVNISSVLVIDDEPMARTVLTSLVTEFCPALEIVGTADGVEAGIRQIKRLKPDIVFLDVEMGDGLGFDLLDHFPNASFKVIFTTAHDKFALRAFKYYAVGFLLKPIQPEELTEVVSHVVQQDQSLGLSHLLKALQEPKQKNIFDRIALSASDGITLLKVKDIVRIESSSGYSTFYSNEGEKIMVARSIGEFEELLPADLFYRVHVSHLVNIQQVKKYLREDGGFLLMENGHQVPIARRRKEEFLEILKGNSFYQ